MSSHPEWFSASRDDPAGAEDGLSNGACEVEAMVALHCPGDGDQLSLSNDGISEFSNSDLSLPEVCVSTNSARLEEDMSYEVQQAYRIFTGFLLDKNKGITGPFLNPVGHQEAQHGVGGVKGRGQSQLRQSMCLRKMEEKFSGQEYETITEFVSDFRLMLENCYRYHGVDHWISKQAQKLELMLEQKLTLLSRTLREKTTLAVTSKGRFGAEEDRGSTGTTTRRRTAPRSLATLTISGHESVMVQALRLEEQQRAKEEKRQRELEKKEAEEMSAKEVEEWEQGLLSQACPQAVDTLWELPAIGHFLCLAQTALNLPEVVFFELERCLLMPRCSLLLSKVMSSLLSPTPRRATLHRRPALPYHRWEAELRQHVTGWYRTVGASRDQPHRAEQLGLCHQFFGVLGEVSPLEVKPFHLLPFYQRVWLLKGLCDHVYETQKDVQDAVLAQPIHECRESILGYDSKENAYIHFPHFCGADLRIYCQSPSTPPAFPFPSVWVRQVEKQPGMEGEESDGMKDEEERKYGERYGVPMDTEECSALGLRRSETLSVLKKDKGHCKDSINMFESWSRLKKEVSDSDSCEDSKIDLKTHNSLSVIHVSPSGGGGRGGGMEIDSSGFERQSKRFILKQRQGFLLGSLRTIKAETQEPCLNVGEHSYTGRSPARSANPPSPTKAPRLQTEGGSPSKRRPRSSCSDGCESSDLKSEEPDCFRGSSRLAAHSSPENTPNSSEEKASDKIWTKKRRRKKKQRGREQLLKAKGGNEQRQPLGKTRMSQAVKAALRKVSTNMKRKDRKKKHKTGRKPESSKQINEPPVEPSFKLVCSSLEELRDLISKTEDELDDLESTKKRLGRWYYRREAVKDLHSTLIRLLNELSPWEPKLIKAHQRNRLRLKKEFDDFKKQPEYHNFVREECISSSSDEDEDDEVRELGKDVCSPTDRLEEEDLEHLVPRGLWSGANTREFGMELPAENHLKHPEKDVDLLPRVEKVSLNMTPADSKQPELSPTNQCRDSASVSPRSPVLHPTSALPKGYTPIPTLLAKSVGNKVTLMKRPADFPGVGNVDAHSQGPSLSLHNVAAGTTNPSKAQSPPFDLQQGPAQTQALGQPRTTAALPQSTQTKPMQSVPKNPIQVLYKVPEGLGHLVKKDSSSPIRFSVQPIVDHNTREKILQQVVILPSNLLIHKAEAKATPLSQQQSKGIQVAVPKVASPLCLSTDVPGFSIPENRIPVQQVAPLRDARTVSSPPPSVLPGFQQGTISTAGGVKACSVPATKSRGLTSNPPPITSLSTALSTEPIKAADLKQELKTVCIRDSQSILVTTRGGNTGIVKVQTSSDQSGFGSFPSSPVINISPQFKAFLVSKTSPTLCPPAPSQTQPSSLSVTHSQKQTASIAKPPSTVTIPIHTAVSGNIPITAPGSHSAGSTVAITQGSLTSVGPTVGAKITQRAQTSTAGSQTQTPVPLLSRSNIPQLLTQELVSKTGLKRASTDEGAQVSKFILVTPSSSSASNVALPRGPAPSAQSVPSSRVMIIGQPTVVSSTTLTGSIPKQPMATAPSGQAIAASLPSHTLKMGFSAGPPPGGGGISEPSSQARNITPPSGFQIQLSGKMTTIGQSIGALSFSPSKCKPVSGSDSPTANGPIPVTSLNPFTSCSSQLGCHGSLTSSSQLRGIPSLSTISHTSCSTPISTVPTLPAGNATNKDPSMLAGILSNRPAAESSQAQTVPDSWHSFIQSGIVGETISASASSQLARNKIPALLPSAPAGCTPFTASASGTVQQRIVINTSTPLAAGTQILLNNACFVVPPQGLGPGSHVLIISSPAPPQVPTAASATSSGASVPYYGAGHPSVAPLAPVLPQSGAGPAVTSPFVSPSLLSTAPHVTPVKLTGAPGLSSAPLPSNTNVVSAHPRSPAVQAGNFASPAVDSHTLGSPLLKLGSLPAPVATSTSAFSSARAAFRLPAATQAACPSAASSTVASTFPRMPGPLSSLPVLPSPSTVALPVPALLSSAAAPEVTETPASPSTQQLPAGTSLGPGILPLQDAVGAAAPSTGQPQALVHIGLGNTPVKKQAPATQTVLTGTRTQVLPTVAVPPIVSAASRIQTLPVATVPPIGSTVNTTETAPVGTVPSSNTTVAATPAPPITSLKTNSTINPSVDLSSQGCGKLSAQTSVLAVHANMASRLLISPDGAVLSIVQSHIGSPELTADSPTGALQTHDSSLQPIQSDTK